MADLSKDQQAQLNQRLAQDPTYQQMVQAIKDPATPTQALTGLTAQLWQYLNTTYGVPLTKGKNYNKTLNIANDGTVNENHDTRNQLIRAGITIGGAYALSYAPGMGLNPNAGNGMGAGLGSGGVPSPAGSAPPPPDGGSPPAASGWGWKDVLTKVLPPAAGIAADIYNTKSQNDANQKAVDAQSKAAENALAFTKEQWADLKRRRAPFEAASLGSLKLLYKNMGLGDLDTTTPVDPNAPGNPTGNPTLNPSPITPTPTPYMKFPYEGTTPVGNNQGPPVVDATGRRIYVPPNPNVPSATYPQTGGTLSGLNGGQPKAMVRMRAPDGSIGQVPQDKVTQATAAGGVVI